MNNRTIFIAFLCWGMLIASIYSASIFKEGVVVSETGRNLKLYYFDENLSKFYVKVITSDCTAFQVFPNGIIYCMVKSPVLYKEKTLPIFGIKLIFIKEPGKFDDFYSGICINPATREMYFSKREKLLVTLYKLNFTTGKEVKLTNKNQFKFIGIPALSPDRKKIAFYCATKSGYQLQVAFYDIKSKLTKIIAPPSIPIFPYGPDMNGSPVWSKDSSKLYFMAIYPEISKKKGIHPGVYKVAINGSDAPIFVCEGGWPVKSNDEITCTLIDKLDSGIWRISPQPMKLIFRNGGLGKLSPSGSLVSFGVNRVFCVSKINDDIKLILLQDNPCPAASWIKLKLNVSQNNQK